jgi:Fe2+ transport system protein FeoA
MNVFDLCEGSSAEIVKVNVQNSAKERLLLLGIKEGAQVDVLGFSLFSSSVLLGVGYTRVAIRKELAKKIDVKCLSEPQKNVNSQKNVKRRKGVLICRINFPSLFKSKHKVKCRHKLKSNKKRRENKKGGSHVLFARSKNNVIGEK